MSVWQSRRAMSNSEWVTWQLILQAEDRAEQELAERMKRERR